MNTMMNMDGMGWMLGGMGLLGLLVIALLVLGVAALVKYLFFDGNRKSGSTPPADTEITSRSIARKDISQ